jgi:hypothetical protein
MLHASRITVDTFPPGLVARAITAAAAGDRARAQNSIQRLVAINPDWASDPRRLLANQFLSPLLIDRLAHGLAEAGLHDAIDEANASAPAAAPRRRSSSGSRRSARRSSRSCRSVWRVP